MYELFLNTPHIGSEEKKEVNKALDSGMLTCGDYIEKFESLLSEKIGCLVSLCSSGTAALHLGLHALGIKPGDEVIVPNVSFISTINVILYMRAVPVLCDIGDPEYGVSIDPGKITKLITPRTKVIIIAHLFGGHGNIEQILKIAQMYKIDVIEDSAQSMGCFVNGKALGTFGKFGIYSLNGNKIITAGGGGVFITSDRNLILKVKNLLNQAKDRMNLFFHSEMGYNYRISNIHAAISYAQLKKLDSFIKRKRVIHEIYKKRLNIISYKEVSNYWQVVYKLEKTRPYQVYVSMANKKIECRPLYVPFHKIEYLKRYCKDNYPMSEKYYSSLLCLPSDLSLDEESINRVVDEIKALETANG